MAELTLPADKPLILASGSPRRRALLAMVGVQVDVVVSNVDEEALAQGLEPEETVITLAQAKVNAVAADGYAGRTILGADTVVVCAGQIMGKPIDRDHAVAMLQRMSDQLIDVHSGVAMLHRSEAHTHIAHSLLKVHPLTDAELDTYLAADTWSDKAGALDVQGAAKGLVDVVTGSRSNVYGLPLKPVMGMLKIAGIPLADPPSMAL